MRDFAEFLGLCKKKTKFFIQSYTTFKSYTTSQAFAREQKTQDIKYKYVEMDYEKEKKKN